MNKPISKPQTPPLADDAKQLSIKDADADSIKQASNQNQGAKPTEKDDLLEQIYQAYWSI